MIEPEDVWAQLSASLSVADLVAIGDTLITGTEPFDGVPPVSDAARLADAVRRHGRRRGVRSLRLALERIRYGSLSPQESRLRVALMDAGLPEPVLNFPIEEHGRRTAMIDLAYPDERVAIEYLGDHHRTEKSTYRADIHRRERLVERGWSVVFVTAADDLHHVTIRVRRLLHRTSPG